MYDIRSSRTGVDFQEIVHEPPTLPPTIRTNHILPAWSSRRDRLAPWDDGIRERGAGGSYNRACQGSCRDGGIRGGLMGRASA